MRNDFFEIKKQNKKCFNTLLKLNELVEVNPEFYTVWHYRKEIFLKNFDINDNEVFCSKLEKELDFTMRLLKKYTKCYWIWNHRMWCLCLFDKLNKPNWDLEKVIVSKVLKQDSRNFHGWQYRNFIFKKIEKNIDDVEKEKHKKDFLILKHSIDEFRYISETINKDTFNFSAWHYRSTFVIKIKKLISNLDNEKEKEKEKNNPFFSNYKNEIEIFQNSKTFFFHDLELIKSGIYMDVNNSSVWQYYFWLFNNFFSSCFNEKNRELFMSILKDEFAEIEELNNMEKNDHDLNNDNIFCLNAIIFILNKMISFETNFLTSISLKKKINSCLIKLIELDPLRKGRYQDYFIDV